MACVYCNCEVYEVWNLGFFPPSDTFCDSKKSALNMQNEKLAVGCCRSCGLTQNTVLLSEEKRYKDNDYAYSSANSSYAKMHWAGFIEDLKKKNLIHERVKLLEIGANDGFLLNEIKSHFPTSDVVGLDASPFQVSQATQNFPDLKMLQCIFGVSSDTLPEGHFDIVIANNVLNHSNQLSSFLSRVSEVLISEGYFIFEVPSVDMMFLNNKWDQIYHEHVSYFSINSLMHILPLAGFIIVSIELNDYHGGSYRVVLRKSEHKPTSKEIIINSEELSLLRIKEHAEIQQKSLKQKIESIKSESSKKIYFFGAPAKGVTFMNYCNLSHDLIEGCLETSSNKIGKYVPKSGIPIISEKHVEKGSYIINLLWNIPNVFTNFCNQNNMENINYEVD